MFQDDIDLVRLANEVYGPLPKPVVEVGGLDEPTIASFKNGLCQRVIGYRPLSPIVGEYMILNPEKGDPPIERLPKTYRDHFGTVICLSVLEHVESPVECMQAINEILQPGGIVIISTVFSWPYHPSPHDYWRFTPECLRMLADRAYLRVLMAEWTIDLSGVVGLRDHPVDVSTVCMVAQK
jgi:SAM-dependent methyltransferase